MANNVYLNNVNSVRVTFDGCEFTNIGMYVYALIFPDNTIYVGAASQNLANRIQNHATHYINGRTRKDLAIKTHREFKVVVLRECSCYEELKYYERYYIHSLAKRFAENELNIEYDSTIKSMVKCQILNDNLL